MAGVISRGIKAPIIKSGDDIIKIVTDSVLHAMDEDGFLLRDGDIVAVTESVVARADGNYANVDHIAADVQSKFGKGKVGLVFPILSRNRFSLTLKGIARGCEKLVILLSYPSDEVGNHLFSFDDMDAADIDPYKDVLTVSDFRRLFGNCAHPFTGIDYVEFYESIVKEEGCEVEIIFSNRPEIILNYASNIICCDIHSRERTKRRIEKAGGKNLLTLCDILHEPVSGSGYCPDYGLLGSNKATETTVKLFPKNAQEVAEGISAELSSRLGVRVEAMVYGDGAFKDPVGKIWELADPVVSPGFTEGLSGLPNELKLKYLVDNDYPELSGEELTQAVRESIKNKDCDLKATMASEGTTPRRLTDLIGSLCDLTSGSGDKGTPIIVVQNYFLNFADK
ncbi:MAG: F420-0--gamma-glutamyl ligase [Ruminococcaceae bacterium]|nr:F420-0--gamma-glutamyl ligase [Oscillospiraceae bacterium]